MKELLFKRILSILDLKPNRQYSILDLGCGAGVLLGAIFDKLSEGSNLVGINAREQSIQQARSRYPGIDFQVAKFIDSFNFADNSFDIVIAVDTLERIPNKKSVVIETKPRG